MLMVENEDNTWNMIKHMGIDSRNTYRKFHFPESEIEGEKTHM